MPFQSEAQRRYMFMEHPDIAHRWSHESGAKNKGLPYHKRKSKRHAKRSQKRK